MPLTSGTRLGPYEIAAQIGMGGMGEVYKARDTRLDRTVAIKVLPEHVADDPDLKQRFEHEARAVAALNHPHICTLHDIGHQDGIDFLVMEHLEGETLQDRLKKGALALDQALRYAIEIADALDTAHRNGITHRDLKPGNIFLTTSGAKLIDFGLAKLRQPRAAGEHARTLSEPLTAPGTIIGTLLYMAPEQLEGQKADARSDIWAFGCVLYEMVTGRRAFEGKSQTSVLAAIIEREPTPMPSVEPMTPAGLDYVVTTSLAKAPDDRWQTARDLLRELRRVAAGGAVPTASARPITPQSLALWQRPLAVLAIVAVAVLVTGLAVWSVTRPDGSTPSALRRFALDVGMSQPITLAGVRAMPVLSPDGSQLVYAANITGTPQLYWRSLDQLEAQPLAETDNAHDPFFSLDGDWVGFMDPAAGELKKVSLRGGSSRSLCECAFLGGGTWLGDGTIIFAHGVVGGRSVLSRVSEAGGTPEPLTTLDAERGESAHVWPHALPGGKAVVFTILPGDAGASGSEGARVAVLSLETGDRHVVVENGYNARYVPTGHLIFGRGNALWGVPFDVDRLGVNGTESLVLEGIEVNDERGVLPLSTSADGALVYRPGDAVGIGAEPSTLVWVNRQGREEPLGVPPRPYTTPAISPDGTRIAVGANYDIWIWHVIQETLTRLTFDPAWDVQPLWAPDGQRIAFGSFRGGALNLYWRAADGTGQVERLTESPNLQEPSVVSSDGTRLVFTDYAGASGDLTVLSLDDDRTVTPLLQTAGFSERNATLSPDDQWIAYESDESGHLEVYVRPFPNLDDGRWQISQGGGMHPLWRPDGRELFYRDPSGRRLMAVSIETGTAFERGNPEMLFEDVYVPWVDRNYAISANGERFLMIKPVTPTDEQSSSIQLILIENWFEELTRLVPTN